jgi:hypothetical protein
MEDPIAPATTYPQTGCSRLARALRAGGAPFAAATFARSGRFVDKSPPPPAATRIRLPQSRETASPPASGESPIIRSATPSQAPALLPGSPETRKLAASPWLQLETVLSSPGRASSEIRLELGKNTGTFGQ